MGIGISPEQKEAFEKFVSKDELFDAMMTLKVGKCQGIDGISLEFYRKFWKLIVDPLHAMLEQSFHDGTLSYSARKGIINLIPKGGSKDEKLVQSYRPIMILDYDYKIYAKALSNRIDTTMSLIVGPEQNGFIKGRSIFTNLNKTREIIAYLNKKNLPGVIAIVDYAKCFDRLEYKSIQGMLKYLNYGDQFVKMVFLLYNNFQVCTQNSGFLSDFFVKKRGVNQGCPASPGIYTQVNTVLSHLIQLNKDICGISMHGLQHLLSLFADDTAAFLSYDPITINGFCEVLNKVEANLGLKVSYEKTSLYRVGSLMNSVAKCYTVKPLTWSNGPIDTLGLKFNCDGSINESNFEKIVDKANKVFNNWCNRKMELIGKILIINTLVASLFVYSMGVMANLSELQIGRISKMIHGFLWDGRSRGRISMYTLSRNKDEGGLRLVDIKAKQDALKIQSIFNSGDLLNNAYHELGTTALNSLLWKCNLSKKDSERRFGKNEYWAQVLSAWCKINHKDPDSKNDILEELLWLNSHIVQGGNVLYWPRWISRQVLTVGDITQDGQLLQWDTFRERFPNLNWLEYQILCKSIPGSRLCKLQGNVFGPTLPKLYDKFSLHPKITRLVYDMLIKDETNVMKYGQTWIESGITDLQEEEYLTAFKQLHKVKWSPKMVDFQYRLLLNKLVFNEDLKKWGRSESDLCSFCNNASENVKHLLLECRIVKCIWRSLAEETVEAIKIDLKSIVLNKIHANPANIFNEICVIIKQFIYRCRCQGKQPVRWKEEIDSIHECELYNSRWKHILDKHIKKWVKYKPELRMLISKENVDPEGI